MVLISYFLFGHKWLYFWEKLLIASILLLSWFLSLINVAIDANEAIFLIIAEIFLLMRELKSFLFNYQQFIHNNQIEQT